MPNPELGQSVARSEQAQAEFADRFLPRERRCDQCGRKGTRGFVTIPRSHQGPTDGVESFTVCKAGPACRKRRREAAYPDD